MPGNYWNVNQKLGPGKGKNKVVGVAAVVQRRRRRTWLMAQGLAEVRQTRHLPGKTAHLT
jgi:hypothetical protein